MSAGAAIVGAAAAFTVAGTAALVAVRTRTMRVGERVAPYRPTPHGVRSPRVGAAWADTGVSGRWRAVVGGRARTGLGARGGTDRLAAQLRAAGLDDASADVYRVRQYMRAGLAAASGVLVGGALVESALLAVLLGASGAAVGFTRDPARLARLAEERRLRIRLELVTINQVLAIHVRAGAGPVQAITRVVARGHGVVVAELRAILASIRAGRSEADAFRHAARLTAEPHAARTYRLFALAAEQGADLGGALRALSDDLRDVRRDELRRQATRRRAAMLIPTIAVLAPIMLLFVIAPIPSIVLGGR